METRGRFFRASPVFLGLVLMVSFGCTSDDERVQAAPVAADSGYAANEGLSPEDRAIVDAVRASGIKVMTPAELKQELSSDKPPVLVDVLSAASYSERHYKGSISMPADAISVTAAQLLPDRNARIVVYCAGFKCAASTGAAGTLQKMGYLNVYDFKGGLEQQRQLGVPLEGSKAGG